MTDRFRWFGWPAIAQPAPASGASTQSKAGSSGPVRLTIICAIFLVIAIAAGTVVFLSGLRNRVLAENERELTNSALILAKHIENVLKATDAAQKSFAEQAAAYTATEDDRLSLSQHDVHLKLRDKVAGLPHVGSLSIFDAKGRLINFSRQWPVPDIRIVDRDFFQALQGDVRQPLFVSEPVRNRASGSWVMHLARRMSGPNGEFAGVISSALELDFFQTFFSDIALADDSSIALFRADGTLLVRHPRNEADIGRRYSSALALKLVSNSSHGMGINVGVLDGQSRMVAARRVDQFPVVVTATKVMNTMLADWRRAAFYMICAALLAIVVVGVLTLVFIRLFRNHQALTEARAEREKADRLREQSLRFDVALNNMSQGLVMFDAAARLAVCNQRYLEIYNLSSEVVKPGISLFDLVRYRADTGSFQGDAQAYCSGILDNIARRVSTTQRVETAQGRIIHVVNQPMADGAWVATHEDVTDKVRAEDATHAQKQQLNAALGNISQGLCMFDAAQRLIVCNKRYADLYGLSESQTRPGTSLHTILQHRIAIGSAPEDQEGYIRDRLNEVSVNKPYQIVNRLRDGRYVSVVHRPMANGGWVATHEDVTEATRREESFRLLFEENPVPMWVVDRESFRFLAVNEAAVRHYGYSRDKFLTLVLPDLRPTTERGSFTQFLQNLSDAELIQHAANHVKSDGTEIHVAVYSRALTYAGRKARLAAVHDITQAKAAEEELLRTRQFLDTIIDNVPLPIIVKDVDGSSMDARDCRFTLVNRACEEIMGIGRDQVIGKTTHELYPRERADHVVAFDDQTLQSDQALLVCEHSLVTPNNGTRLVTARKVAIRDKDDSPKYLLTVLDDVTERRRAEDRIWHLAHNDSLTNLPNRATFIEHFAETLANASETAEPFAILCMDLDRFKEANDVYGHLVGDGLLREAALRLQKAAGGAFVARVGGDEFTLIVTGGPQPETAEALAECLLAAFEEDFEIDGHRLQIGLSIGGAVYPTDGADAKTLMTNADAALYRVKAEMRGSARFFEAELGRRLRERRDLQGDLRSALDRGDLFLHYQPQKRIGSNETLGFEALTRWQCPKRGMVAPDIFIPIAEESSLIVPLGDWILREACREAASWPEPLKIAVNLSPVQFHHGDLPRLVHSALLATGLAPGRLELEITEGVLIEDFSRAVSILHRLKALGVQIAMDDFGSGYSSLSYLHSFPFDKIKIDRTFVKDLDSNRHSMAIVRAVIGLGQSLNIPILAEGVETRDQLRFLAEEGCDEVQGYLLGRPMLIDNYADLVGRSAPAQSAAATG